MRILYASILLLASVTAGFSQSSFNKPLTERIIYPWESFTPFSCFHYTDPSGNLDYGPFPPGVDVQWTMDYEPYSGGHGGFPFSDHERFVPRPLPLYDNPSGGGLLGNVVNTVTDTNGCASAHNVNLTGIAGTYYFRSHTIPPGTNYLYTGGVKITAKVFTTKLLAGQPAQINDLAPLVQTLDMQSFAIDPDKDHGQNHRNMAINASLKMYAIASYYKLYQIRDALSPYDGLEISRCSTAWGGIADNTYDDTNPASHEWSTRSNEQHRQGTSCDLKNPIFYTSDPVLAAFRWNDFVQGVAQSTCRMGVFDEDGRVIFGGNLDYWKGRRNVHVTCDLREVLGR